MRRFRFGVNMWTGGSRAEWMDKARQLEDLGYGVLTVPDHLADFWRRSPRSPPRHSPRGTFASARWSSTTTSVIPPWSLGRRPPLICSAMGGLS